LRPGLVHSGDIYNLESWQERVEVVDVRGSHLSNMLAADLEQRDIARETDKTYTVATTAYVAGETADKLGRVQARRKGPLLRDLTVDYLRAHGFPGSRG